MQSATFHAQCTVVAYSVKYYYRGNGAVGFSHRYYNHLKGLLYEKGPPRYRDYSLFCALNFRIHLSSRIKYESIEHGEYGTFDAAIMGVLNKHAPIRMKYILANDGPFMTKELYRECMHRRKLLKKYKRDRTEENFSVYREQRNKCVKLLRKTKSYLIGNLNLANLTKVHKFWKTIKALVSAKV